VDVGAQGSQAAVDAGRSRLTADQPLAVLAHIGGRQVFGEEGLAVGQDWIAKFLGDNRGQSKDYAAKISRFRNSMPFGL
jgi:hypothetical protein